MKNEKRGDAETNWAMYAKLRYHTLFSAAQYFDGKKKFVLISDICISLSALAFIQCKSNVKNNKFAIFKV